MTSSVRPSLSSLKAPSRRARVGAARRAPVTFQHNLFFCIFASVLWYSFTSLKIRPDAFTGYLSTTLSFIAVGIVSFLGIYDAARERAFSLNTAHWTYVLFFLFYAPFIQFLTQQNAFQSDIGMFDQYAIWINCMTLAWCGCYYFFYGSPALPSEANVGGAEKPASEYICTGWTYFCIIFVCIATLGVLLKLMGVEVLLLRSASGDIAGSTSDKSAFLLVNSIGRAIPVMTTALLMLTRGKSKFAHWGTFAISALFTLLMNNPVAIARFWFGAIMIGFFCLYLHVRKSRATGLWLAMALTMAGLTIFPVLSATRYVRSVDEIQNVELASDWSDNLTGPDFDGYSMIIATVEWVNREGTAAGYQLIGNSLFWIPRTFWYDKPVGSGQTVAEYFAMINTNMAEPMTAEAYINFGWMGIPLYALAIGRFFSAVDRRYWSKGQNSSISLTSMMYPFLTALTIYFLRGDYLSGVSSTLALLVSAIFVIWMFRATSRRTSASP